MFMTVGFDNEPPLKSQCGANGKARIDFNKGSCKMTLENVFFPNEHKRIIIKLYRTQGFGSID